MAKGSITELIDPKALKDIEVALVQAKKLDDTLTQISKSRADNKAKVKQLSAAEKEALKIEKERQKAGEALFKQKERGLQQMAKEEQKLRAHKEALNKETKSLNDLREKNKALRKEMGDVDRTTKKGRKEMKQFRKEIDANDKQIKKYSDSLTKQKINIGNYGSAFGKLTGPIGMVNTAFKALLANPIVAILAAIVGVFVVLRKAMTRSEDGQNRLNKAWKVASSVLDNVWDILTAIGVALFDSFPKILNVVGNKFKQWALDIQRGFLKVQIWIQSMLGHSEKVAELTKKLEENRASVDELAEENKKLGAEISKAFEPAIEKAKSFGEEVEKDIERAKALADLEARTNKFERESLVQNAKLQKESAKFYAEAQRLKKTDAVEAIEMTKKAFDLDEQVLDNQVKLAQMKLQIAQQTSALAEDDIEAKMKIAQAEAAVYNAEASFNDKRRQRTRMLNMLRMEAFKQEKERTKARISLQEMEMEQAMYVNDQIIDDEKAALDERVAAVYDNARMRNEIAGKQLNIEKAELDKRKELALISDEDYKLQLQLLEQEHTNEIFNINAEAAEKLTELDEEVLEAKLERMEKETEAAREQFEKRAQLAQALNQAIMQTGNAIFNMRLQQIQSEIDAEEQGSEKQKQLRKEQVRMQRKQAMFNAITNTAGAIISAAMTQPFIPLGIIAVALATALGAIQIATIQSQPIPEFYKGTTSAPSGLISVGERGRELIQTRQGKLLMANQPTLTSGLGGARIFTNRETEMLMGASAMGYDSGEIKNTLIDNNRQLIDTIKNKKEIHIGRGGKRITEREGNYYKTYLNRKIYG